MLWYWTMLHHVSLLWEMQVLFVDLLSLSHHWLSLFGYLVFDWMKGCKCRYYWDPSFLPVTPPLLLEHHISELQALLLLSSVPLPRPPSSPPPPAPAAALSELTPEWLPLRSCQESAGPTQWDLFVRKEGWCDRYLYD